MQTSLLFAAAIIATLSISTSATANQDSNNDGLETKRKIVAEYCYGSTKALDQLKAYCARNTCNSKVRGEVEQYCQKLGRTVDTEQLLPSENATARQSQPSESPELPDSVTRVLAPFCKGDPKARDTVVDYCLNRGCSQQYIEKAKQFCRDQNQPIPSMDEVIAASAAHTLSGMRFSDDTNANDHQQARAAKATGNSANRSLVVSWRAPGERVDGKPISTRELAGYEVYLVSADGEQRRRFRVNDPGATQYRIHNLPPGKYFVAVVSKDKNSSYSSLSAISSATIP